VTTTAAPGGWVARLVAQAARNAADDLDHSGHRLWRKAGWTATVPAGDRLVLTGPDASTVTYLIPGVHLPTALHLPVHPDQASTDEHPTVPGVHLYAPHGAARDVFTTAQDEVLLSGPAGTGKSRAALELLNLLALAWPGMRGLVIRKTLTSLGSTALVTWREKVIPEALEAGLVHFYGGSQQEAAAYRYANGSAINLGGMDKSTRVMSSDYDVVYVQEAIELTTDNWEALTTRLRNARTPVQQLLADTNPDKPTHWLNVRCQRGDTRMLHCRHSDNPTLIAPATGKPTLAGAAYLAKLAKLTGVRKARLEGGKWVAAEGIIYDGYDPAIHLVDRFEIPADWTRWIVVDFGFTNPFTAQWYAEDGDGRLWMYREIYHTRRLVEDHARTMLAQMRDGDGVWLEPRPTAVICDHDAEDRATLERHLGMSTSAAHKTVKDGIQAMQARLRPAGDGKPRLYILRDSLVELDPELEEAKKPTCFAEELPGYVWDPAGATAAVPRETKETPLKVDDHGCLIAGTLVATTAGDVPIEQIRPWHLVLTRAGPRPVVASGMTMPAAEVVQVLLSTGEVLVGTGDHPVWVNERGWSRLDSLGYGDRLMGCPTSSELSSPESHSAATQTLHIRPTATTSLLESPTGSGESAKHGPIPEGCEVHHLDFDPLNNDPGNLACVTIAEHKEVHREQARVRSQSPEARAHLERIRPLAAAWHSSPEGLDWHRWHAEVERFGHGPVRTSTCEQCGADFETTNQHGRERFCSNRCKTAWRYASGVDDEQRTCPQCGTEFTTNRYSRKECCGRTCAQRLRSARACAGVQPDGG